MQPTVLLNEMQNLSGLTMSHCFRKSSQRLSDKTNIEGEDEKTQV